MNWVWDHSRSRNGSRLVLLAIADCAKDHGLAWPSVAELKRKTGLGDRAVQAAVIDLAKIGELEVGYQEGPKGCNRYRVTMKRPPAVSAPPPQNVRGSEPDMQVNGQHPADIAPPQILHPADPALNGFGAGQTGDPRSICTPPAECAPPQISTLTPAESADGTVREPIKNSLSESSISGAIDPGALFDAPPAKPRRGRKVKPSADPIFDKWYATYPLHKDRGDAEKAWPDALAEVDDPQILVAAAERYHDDPQVRKGYAKHPGRWLRAKCWLDEPAPEPAPAASNGTGHKAYQNPADPEHAYEGTF